MLGIVSDKEFEKEIEKSRKASLVSSDNNGNKLMLAEGEESLINSISSNSNNQSTQIETNQTRVEDADGNIESNEINSAQHGPKSNEFKEPQSSNELSEELCGKIVDINKPGRRLGDNNVPESLRKIIGAESIESGRKAGLNLASHFGISPSSVSAYSHGSTSDATYNKPNESLLNHVNNAREKVSRKARNKLLLALNSLNSENISQSKARDIASIAKDMSAVVKNMEDRTIQSVHEGPKFIFYSPTIRDERNFDIINVKE